MASLALLNLIEKLIVIICDETQPTLTLSLKSIKILMVNLKKKSQMEN